MAGYIQIWARSEADALTLPSPDNDGALQTQSTAVDGGFNGNNQFIGQKVGRDRSKIELSWRIMDAALWKQVLTVLDAFVIHVRYYDAAKGITVRQFYTSDRSSAPLTLKADGITWDTAKNCKLNLIDTGRDG